MSQDTRAGVGELCDEMVCVRALCRGPEGAQKCFCSEAACMLFVCARRTDFVGEERCFRCQAYLLCKLPSLESRIIVLTNSVALMVKCQMHKVARALAVIMTVCLWASKVPEGGDSAHSPLCPQGQGQKPAHGGHSVNIPAVGVCIHQC